MKLSNLLNKIHENSFVKHVLTLLSGGVISQIIVFLLMLWLARIYSDAVFGVYFIFVGTFNILRKVTTLNFENAIILPKRDRWAINAWAVTVLFTIIISSLFFVISIFFKKIILEINDLKKIADFIFLLPISLLFVGLFDSFIYWDNRIKKYKKIVSGRIVLSSTTGFSQMFMGLFGFLNIGLIIGFVIGYLVATITIISLTIRDIIGSLKYISMKKMIFIVKYYRKIPAFNSLITFSLGISNELPVYLLSGFYGLAFSGFYGMANKIAASPMGVIANSVGQVFYQKASQDYNKTGDISNLIKKTYKNLLKISILPTATLLIITPFLHYVLGKEWHGISWYIIILTPTIFFNFLAQPVSGVYTIVGKQDIMLIFNIAMILIKFLSIWLGYYIFDNIFSSLILLSVVTSAYRIFLLWWYLKISKSK